MTRGRRFKPFVAISAALGWVALALQFTLSLRVSIAHGKGVFGGLAIYFSFFTILTNFLVALALTASLLRVRSSVAEFFTRPGVNTGIEASIALVGIAYALLLQHLWHPEGLQLVADMLLHYVMPSLFLVYWWVAVPKADTRWTSVFVWMLYPVLYFMYAMTRGALSGVYPYPFINAAELGYRQALANALGVLAGFVVLALTLVTVERFKGGAASGFAVRKPTPSLAQERRLRSEGEDDVQ
ncbi:Pr6Pr family membrane protein [Acidithiobacillus ferrivorans]|uniref:Pr6Pr family membrane protein n=1 Tax=Acidithiobacillus ferrivorans TaxID=160808 RepID=UPI001C3FFD20|nr:Pr6Pr family membrane protein [Acidithiobacillus ferrivorans]